MAAELWRWTPDGVANVSATEESWPVIRLDGKHLPDLDELVMWLAGLDESGEWAPGWELAGQYGEVDEPTAVPWRSDGQVVLRWLRTNPCCCDQPPNQPHGWHIDEARLDTEGEPIKRRGVFLGVWEW
jgi:hypothetical protein